MIDNIQLKKRCNEELRPMADNIASLCLKADTFMARFTDEDILIVLGIAPKMISDLALPTEQEFPDEAILDGAEIDGRPILTRRKVLQLLRIVAQLRYLKEQEQYGVPKYTQSVAFSMAVNVRG